MPERLPVHGFVLAGGKSSRMGKDKALLPFGGRPMVEIAVEKLRTFCARVSISGNRSDLGQFAPIVLETRTEAGPAAGIEAGLRAAESPWALFMPVDVPLVPATLLRRWAEAVLDTGRAGCGASFLLVRGERQPAFCMLRRECLGSVSAALDRGERKLAALLESAGKAAGTEGLRACDAARFAEPGEPSPSDMEFWFSNVNTAQDLKEAEASLPNDRPQR